MKNREQQNQPIQDSDSQVERNPRRAFPKAKVLQASGKLNPDRDKIYKFSGQPLPEPTLDQGNIPSEFRFGSCGNFTPNRNFLQDCVGENPVVSHLLTSTSSGVPLGNSTPISILFHSSNIERSRKKVP